MNLGGIANESGVVLRDERISQTAENRILQHYIVGATDNSVRPPPFQTNNPKARLMPAKKG